MAIEGNIRPARGGRCSSRSDDAVIADLAARQHGVVARAQLLALGVGPNAIDHRLACGRLHPIHLGVFAVGHTVRTRGATWTAAVLAAGAGAVLSHRSAAGLWGLVRSTGSVVEVSVARKRRRPGIRTHRTPLRDDEVTVEDGIPVTTPARTLFDLAAVVPVHQLEAAFHEAEFRRLTSPTSLEALLKRYPGRRGTSAIKAVLADHATNGETRTRTEVERRLLALLDAHDLPRPKVNRLTDHGELDATWPEQRVVVECDGFAAHGTRKAFEADRARDRELQVAGWRVVRVTWRQLTDDGDTIAEQLRILLGARPSGPAAVRRAQGGGGGAGHGGILRSRAEGGD